MVHGDDSGLVIPPRIAPVQTMVIPIAQHKEGVLDKANELLDTLKAAGYKAKIDDSDKAPGWKFSGQEILGMDEMNEKFNENLGFIKAMWCGDEACEEEIKAQTGGATSRCIPEEEEQLSDVCICCGKPAKHMVYWSKAY